MNGFRLLASGRALPGTRVTNEDMSRMVETSDEWIRTRTGIRQRYFCKEGESAVSLAVAAAKQALFRSGLEAEEIGCCVCASISSDYATPSMACMVQAALGLSEEIPALDVNAACSGFLYGMTVAAGLLEVSKKKYALVIGSEQLSRLMDMSDRSTCVLFGDGAGAAIFARCEDVPLSAYLGSRGDTVIRAAGPGMPAGYLTMDGSAVFRFAVESIPRCIDETLRRADKTLDEIDWVVCHQANERIIDHCVKKLSAPPEKFYRNIAQVGNTSAASIPLALAQMQEEGLLRQGQTVLCVGFGGGLTWASLLFSI